MNKINENSISNLIEKLIQEKKEKGEDINFLIQQKQECDLIAENYKSGKIKMDKEFQSKTIKRINPDTFEIEYH